MTTVLNPIFESGNDFLRSTRNRFFSVVLPIQATKRKESDFTSYLLNPLIDSFVLEPMFALEASIHCLNALASFTKAFYLWSIKQQESKLLIDDETAQEIGEGYSSLVHAGSAMLAQSLNVILSVLSLLTRPIASVAYALNEEVDMPNEVKYSC